MMESLDILESTSWSSKSVNDDLQISESLKYTEKSVGNMQTLSRGLDCNSHSLWLQIFITGGQQGTLS